MKETKIKIEMKKIPLTLVLIMFFSVLFFAGVNAQFSGGANAQFSGGSFTSSAQYYQPGFQYYSSSQIQTYWADFGKEECEARGDFILNIRPGSCQPAVVRSDLLEERNVPVFCKVDAIKVNPLVDVKSIRSISFRGEYSEGVAGIGFHPANAAVRSYHTLLGSPIMNEAGYLVVVLKRQPSEDEMPDWVEGNLTAVVRYDMENAFGIGRAEFLLPVLTEREWENSYLENGFWRGKGFLRANWVEPDSASISIYRDAAHKQSTVTLKKGETSGDVYLSGFYCKAALQLKLTDVSAPKTRVKIAVWQEGQEDVFWLYEGSNFLDNECRILEINPISLDGGSVKVRCKGETFTLKLGMADSVKLEIAGGEQVVKRLWEPLNDVYVAYVGQIPRSLLGENEKDLPGNLQINKRTFAVFVKAENEIGEGNKESLNSRIRNILERNVNSVNKENFKKGVSEGIGRFLEIEGVEVVFYGESGLGIKFVGSAGASDKEYSGEDGLELEKYFADAIAEYREVVQLYPAEKESEESTETIGEQALKSAVSLAELTGKQRTQQELLQEIVDNYPNAGLSGEAKRKLAEIEKYDLEGSIKTLNFIDEFYTLQLQEIKEPTQDEASATIKIDKKEKVYSVNDYLVSPEEGGECLEFVRLKELEDDFATLEYRSVYKDADGRDVCSPVKTEKVGVREPSSLGRFSVYVSSISLKKVAHVVLTPKIVWPDTEANLSFRIGIEKRGIKLSPEKTQEMIGNLNESIEKFEKISDNLKKVVKGWKTVCFATSAILLVKNLMEGFSGKTMARSRAMRGPGGWIDKCKEIVDAGGGENRYQTLDACLYGERDKIGRDVNILQEAIESVNKRVRETESVTDKTIFGEKILNTEESFNRFMEKFNTEDGDKEIVIYNEDGSIKTREKIKDLIEDYRQDYKEGIYTFSDAREWMLYNELINSPVSDEMKQAYMKEMSDSYNGVISRRSAVDFASSFNQMLEDTGLNLKIKGAYIEQGGKIESWDGSYLQESDLETMKWEINEIQIEDEKVHVQMIPYQGKLYMFRLAESTEGELVPTHETYKVEVSDDGVKVLERLAGEDSAEILDKEHLGISSFRVIEKGKCQNLYKGAKVRLFDVEPFKEMPAVVPFDVKEGWYAGMTQTIKGFGMTPYTDAGILKNFYLCNVGKNGREEFDSGMGDDICNFVSFETGAEITHSCLDETEARTMANKARTAVMDASRQSVKGARKINIFGQDFDVGAPVGGAQGTQCQDFMSPEDCYLLFNTCDPVLCPPSRCNLAGNFHVRDVIQSGIIGSIVLCLPNIREKIIAPVCLTGVQAGIEAYVSILKAERECLQESLDTGKNVGICDEIKSIYLCEFFWRQFAPLMDVFVPKIVEMAYGQGTRGGGEYLTVQHAWDTMSNSVKYMTDYYAQNAYLAFLQRSTDEAGSEICKAFVSARYPTSSDFFDALLEPESPVQYHAWFDEIPFTEATTPATSHYKVYYHIWAGNDVGASYSVFLRNPPESSYYMSIPTIVVDTGYIARGGYVDRTKDFTAPAGYKTLCVRVNTQEECGFGQVSTSFAVDYIAEKYIEEQVMQEVVTERECISGTPSLYPMLQPNIEEGVEEAVSPELYKRGIIRICSTNNPGQQTDPERWKEVGYCDNENLRCWLDIYSVEANIEYNETLAEIEKAVGDISDERIKELIEKGEVISEKEAGNTLKDIQGKIDKLNIEIRENKTKETAEKIIKEFEDRKDFENLQEIEENALMNYQKAKAIFLRGKIYERIATAIKEWLFKHAATQ